MFFNILKTESSNELQCHLKSEYSSNELQCHLKYELQCHLESEISGESHVEIESFSQTVY